MLRLLHPDKTPYVVSVQYVSNKQQTLKIIMAFQEILTRKQLYDLVWSTPLTTLSKKYGMSDNGIRKTCIRMQIPLPTAGHWMRLQFNKHIVIPPLPINYKGNETVSLPLPSKGGSVTIGDPVKALALSLRSDSSISFEVPERLHTKNPLILAAKARLTGKDRYERAGVVSNFRDEMDFKVGIENAVRMLRFADTLIKLLIQRGHEVVVSSMDTYAVVNKQRLKILFREKLKRHIVKGTYYDSHELHPTGILVFKVDGFYGKQWKDGQEKLEYHLPEIIAFLEIESYRRNERDEERRKERLEYERIQQLRAELQAQKEKDLTFFIDTLKKAERWHKAANLRNYIAEIETRGAATAEWLSWAKQKADWYDPFTEAEDEMLSDVNRETLKMGGHRNY